ncbi:ABC transporter ATP-binding protein [Corticicoccus populi]|uniref:ABC transporter ATP-binding protein n=1 Tax=Corticicoccus populi TaxID=1812821 RepID=A0ABW5WT24_9STAP
MNNYLLEVKNLEVQFKSGSIVTKAVNDVSFSLGSNENIGIVGESGSGKSVTATSILKLIPSPPGNISKGEILYQGENIVKKNEREMRKIRGNEISMIFQDASTSLNPVFTVGNQLIEAIVTHQKLGKKATKQKAIEMLSLVGIPAPEKRLGMYPHEFSGGMKQRVMIAIALSSNPKLLIADEPTTALDVTVQAQMLDLMKSLQNEIGMSIIMITHDLGVVWETCQKMIVMYAGKVMESGDVKDIYNNPLHPYTWGLLDSQITSEQDNDKPLSTIPGSPPDLSFELKGCPFAKRCPYAADKCFEEMPSLEAADGSHKVACHFQAPKPQLIRKNKE